MSRIAVLDKSKCKNGESCSFVCGKVCPVNRSGSQCIVLEEDNKPRIDEELCIGCGICVEKCQYDVIKIINLPQELNSDPIHRFGENGFRLFNLPVPRFGKVVGILGKNGIGKSTAIKILAGEIIPNLGNFDKDKEEIKSIEHYKNIINKFKGSELQKYFQLLRENKIKLAYKPQNVDLIPKQFSGKVKELLNKVIDTSKEENKIKLEKVCNELELNKILETDIKNISGGELQRVAIAATTLKDANVYLFDEPTSYLDIKQRIKISKYIKSLVNDDTAVVVIEHDLIILDYLTDLVHILFGTPSAYGIVSRLKSSRNGINTYLSGYSKDENVRFRDKKIQFDIRQSHKAKTSEKLTGWKNIEKKLGNFSFKSEEGDIKKQEVLGILGENGIGKTTFMKILAGVTEKDKGEIDNKIKISYKPQYLNSDYDTLVKDVLKEAIEKYDIQLIKPLNIKPLLEKKIKELSGGELQRVAICLALSREDAELILLDEPSAYLDVEQRLITSKVIKDVIEERGIASIVIDHDMLFIDYLSDRIIIFDGIPVKEGIAKGPFEMEIGMNEFLDRLNITMRRDEESRRPRINKEGSQMDSKQKREKRLYY